MTLPQSLAINRLLLSGYTSIPPIIDGIIEAEEWKAAGKAKFGSFTTSNGETITGIVYAMNDKENLYMAVSIEGDNEFDSMDGFEVFFDNDNGCEKSFEEGDDFVAIVGMNLFFDGYYYTIGKAINPDTIDEGINDGKGAGSRKSSLNQFELSHPLNSFDTMHDFSVSAGQTIGFLVRISIDGKWYNLSAWSLGKLDNPLSFASYLVASPSQGIYNIFLTFLLITIIFLILILTRCFICYLSLWL
ncbi:MAG: hypothetical protein QW589_00310 [Candidatus Bathyarchaeia archaeon]